VDLGAVRHNVRTLKGRASGARLMAVVKADAYGHGAVPVARAALEAGADSLAVVTVAEAAELREAGVRAPILVFTDLLPDDLRRAASLDLEVTAHSVESARRIAAAGGALRVHLKVNTGMNRWGVEPDEVGEALKALGVGASGGPDGGLAGVYTHLASADCDREATGRQLALFDRVLAAHEFGGAVVHAANSAGTLWHAAARYDLVRPGVAVYGLHPKGDEGRASDEALRPALSLRSYVASMRRLEPGEGVSYGLTWRAEGPTFAATVPVGYAEGYRRTLSNRSFALIGGQRRPLLGRVTMDACVFGADPSVRVGDEVVLVGAQGAEEITAEEVGGRAGTINYEVTTSINDRRVERSYV